MPTLLLEVGMVPGELFFRTGLETDAPRFGSTKFTSWKPMLPVSFHGKSGE